MTNRYHHGSVLFCSGVIRIGVKASIDVTLNAELFITSITEKHFLIPGSLLYPRARHMARHTSGMVRNMAYHIEPMARAYGTTFVLSLSSAVVEI